MEDSAPAPGATGREATSGRFPDFSADASVVRVSVVVAAAIATTGAIGAAEGVERRKKRALTVMPRAAAAMPMPMPRAGDRLRGGLPVAVAR